MKTVFIIALFLLSTPFILGQALGYTYDADGNLESRYTVTLRSAQTDEVEPETKKSVSVEFDDRQITVYPNPTQGEICVEILPLNQEEENFMHIFDSSGRLIETKKIESERTYLEVSGNPGVYLLNIHLGENISKWKIIKQ